MHSIPSLDRYQELREALRALCRRFDSAYWQRIDAERGYPEAFVDALTGAGWLAAMIPTEYDGSGLGLTGPPGVLEGNNPRGGNRGGGNAAACHGQMYNMGTLLRHGSEAQKRAWLPSIAAGKLRLQSMAVTEPSTGSDTTRLATTAVRQGYSYISSGQKVWTSRLQHSALMIVLARTTPLAEVKRRSEGMSVLMVDLRDALSGAHGSIY